MSLTPLDQIYTKSDVDVLTREIDVSIDSLYHLKNTPDGKEEELRKLREEVRTWPVLQMRVAFVPQTEQIQKWATWARAHVHPKMVVDVKTDPNLIAGAQIAYQGKYVDLSTRKSLEEYFVKQKTTLTGGSLTESRTNVVSPDLSNTNNVPYT